MGRTLEEEVADAVATHGERGVAMGVVVDALIARGHPVEAIEAAIWALLGARALTPSGFVCRLLRRPGEGSAIHRSYELLLATWSPEQDEPADGAERRR